MSSKAVTAQLLPAFLATLAETANVSASARIAGLSRSAAYECRASDPDFAAAWEAALELGLNSLEDEGMRRAKDGVQKYVVSQGRVVMDPTDPDGKRVLVEHVYSDTLLQFFLRARRPDRYKERTAVDLHVTGDLAGRLEQARKRTTEPSA